jgi:hypothetical protein
LKHLGIRHRAGHQPITRKINRDNLAPFIPRMLNIKPPQQPRQVDEYGAFGDVQTGADSAATAKGKVVSFVDVCEGGVFARCEIVVDEALGVVLPPSDSAGRGES